MEVFIRDEDKEYFISANGQEIIFTGDYMDEIKITSLDQHDLEIRADERKKWQDKFDEYEKIGTLKEFKGR